MWNGEEFFVWGQGTVHRSRDGTNWQQASTSPDNLLLGPSAYGDGSFTAVNGGWQTWYEDQTFYSSTDGITWQTAEWAANSNVDAGHPIRDISFGYVPVGDACD